MISSTSAGCVHVPEHLIQCLTVCNQTGGNQSVGVMQNRSDLFQEHEPI